MPLHSTATKADAARLWAETKNISGPMLRAGFRHLGVVRVERATSTGPIILHFDDKSKLTITEGKIFEAYDMLKSDGQLRPKPAPSQSDAPRRPAPRSKGPHDD